MIGAMYAHQTIVGPDAGHVRVDPATPEQVAQHADADLDRALHEILQHLLDCGARHLVRQQLAEGLCVSVVLRSLERE